MSPASSAHVEAIVWSVEQGTITHAQGLAQLRARGLNPDPLVLTDAAESMRVRDGLLAGDLDPYTSLDAEPRLHSGDLREHAVSVYDARLCDALRALSRAPAVGRAS